MYKRILVPIDGSEVSERAMQNAKTVAETFDGEIVLIYISGVFVRAGFESASSIIDKKGDYNSTMNAVGKEAMAVLETAKDKLGYDNSDAVLIEDVSRNFGHVIAKFAEDKGFDLIVMGSSGLGAKAKRRFLLGSTTTKTLHTATVPVLVIY